MDQYVRPHTSHYLKTRHAINLSMDRESSLHEGRTFESLGRRPSLSALTALFSKSSSTRNTNDNTEDASQLFQKNRARGVSGVSKASHAENVKHRVRRPSMAIANLKRGLFKNKSREELNIDEEGANIEQRELTTNTTKTGWLKKLTSPFKRERTSSMREMEAVFNSDPFYSLSSSVPSYPQTKTKHWNYNGGAAARAAAAAQNEVSTPSLLGYRRHLSRLREPQNDSESGIGIDLHGTFDIEETKSIMIRIGKIDCCVFQCLGN